MTEPMSTFDNKVQEAVNLLDCNTYQYIKQAIINYRPPVGSGYIFARTPPEFDILASLLDHQGHSGASWACLLRKLHEKFTNKMEPPLHCGVWRDAQDMLKDDVELGETRRA